MASHWTWRVPSSNGAVRADKQILAALSDGEGAWSGAPVPCSRSSLQRLIDEGAVTCGGKPIASSTKLAPGSEVSILFPDPRPISLVPEDRPLRILFEDEHLVIVNKPPGLTVHPSETQKEGTLVHALLHHVRDLSGIGGELRPGIVHRIDKDTSGSLVITKTDAAHRALSEIFSRHEIEREYWAFCFGAPKKAAGGIESLIGRNPSDRKKMTTRVKEGRKAVTRYEVVESYGVPRSAPFASWISVRLETGRTHQIRVHLTELGHSLLGDPVYGAATSKQPKWKALPAEIQEAVGSLPGQALHARVLGFKHPITGAPVRVEAEPPEALAELMRRLKRYS